MSDLNKWKMIFGFAMLVALSGMAMAIALGKVEEQTSHGLMPIITALATLSGGFAQWAFGAGSKESKDEDAGK